MIYNISLGCDPELFLKNTDGKFISAVGLIGGSKEKPFLISKEGHAVQEDNVSVEFNIPPSKNKIDFVNNVNYVLSYLKETLKDRKLSLCYDASALFEKDQLSTRAALTFGCDPDFNAWTHSPNPRPRCKDKSLRSCGGHIHVGYDNPSYEDNIFLIKAMDMFISIPLLLQDKDTLRRNLYGKAGACRHKEYGVEYRTPSNFWVREEKSMEFVFEQTHKAIDFVNNLGNLEEDSILIQDTINNNLIGNVPYFMEKYGVTTL